MQTRKGVKGILTTRFRGENLLPWYKSVPQDLIIPKIGFGLVQAVEQMHLRSTTVARSVRNTSSSYFYRRRAGNVRQYVRYLLSLVPEPGNGPCAYLMSRVALAGIIGRIIIQLQAPISNLFISKG